MALRRKESTPEHSPPPVQLAPAGPVQVQRGIRFPQLLVSLLVVGLFGLLGLWWQSTTAARSPVVGLAVDIERGDIVAPDDLTTFFVSTDGGLAATTSADFLELFVGKVATSDLEAGTLVNGSMFALAKPLAPGEAFVGLQLPSNHFPASIVPGDKVDVLLLDTNGADSEMSFEDSATVEAVTPSRTGGNTRIRIRMNEVDAVEVQRAAADNDVVLIQVLDGSDG